MPRIDHYRCLKPPTVRMAMWSLVGPKLVSKRRKKTRGITPWQRHLWLNLTQVCTKKMYENYEYRMVQNCEYSRVPQRPVFLPNCANATERKSLSPRSVRLENELESLTGYVNCTLLLWQCNHCRINKNVSISYYCYPLYVYIISFYGMSRFRIVELLKLIWWLNCNISIFQGMFWAKMCFFLEEILKWIFVIVNETDALCHDVSIDRLNNSSIWKE